MAGAPSISFCGIEGGVARPVILNHRWNWIMRRFDSACVLVALTVVLVCQGCAQKYDSAIGADGQAVPTTDITDKPKSTAKAVPTN